MHYELKATMQPEAIFDDAGFTVGKKQYLYSDIGSVSLFAKPSALSNGVIQILIDGKNVNVVFPKKQSDDGMAVYQMLSDKVEKQNAAIKEESLKGENEELKTAEGVYQYCKKYGYGTGFTDSWGIKHFQIIIDNLMTDEYIIFPFIGLHNYVSAKKHDNNFAYAVTNKRILMAQKRLVGEAFQSVSWENVNDITFTTGMLFGVLTIDTFKETFNVGLDKVSAQKINNEIHEVFDAVRHPKTQVQSAKTDIASDPYEELKKLKDLFDMGVITQEEFDAKKKQLLGL